MTKVKSPVQIVFGRDMILPINHIEDCRYIRQCRQAQLYKDVIRENSTIIDHYYIVVDQLMTRINSAYKYETLFKVAYEIVHTWKNVTVTLQTVAVTMRVDIRNIRPYNTPIAELFDHLQEV